LKPKNDENIIKMKMKNKETRGKITSYLVVSTCLKKRNIGLNHPLIFGGCENEKEFIKTTSNRTTASSSNKNQQRRTDPNGFWAE